MSRPNEHHSIPLLSKASHTITLLHVLPIHMALAIYMFALPLGGCTPLLQEIAAAITLFALPYMLAAQLIRKVLRFDFYYLALHVL
jgi:hypothetical protein